MPILTDAERTALIEAALAARGRAHAPYSGFRVGTALRAVGGRVFEGCNVENVSYGLTMCAERVAIGSAVCAGESAFDAIAIASSGGVSPCGACRQVLAEFGSCVVLMVDAETGDVRESTVDELLPLRFDGDQIEV